MKERIPIPDKLAAEVMFASDRTCCVCRQENSKVQIHHLDEDPSNNAFGNLAVICLHCHSDAHTNGAFVRNLTPELIHLYNTSWREIVAFRIKPNPNSSSQLELASEAFLEASLDCHSWKVHFMYLFGGNLPQGEPGQFSDVWDLMAELWVPKYSEQYYKKFLPLFNERLLHVSQRFDRLIQLFPDVLPADFRATLVRANRHLDLQRTVYLQLPMFLSSPPFAPHLDVPLFYNLFVEVIHVLRNVSREADKRRGQLTNV